MRRTLILFLVVMLCLSLCACGGEKEVIRDEENKEVTSIILSENDVEITIGETHSLTAIVLPEETKDAIKWQSANEEIVTVDDVGEITAVSLGNTTIVVSSENGVSATCSVTVIDKSAYDKLSDDEQEFVDKFLWRAMEAFYYPESLKITKIMEFEADDDGSPDWDGRHAWIVEFVAKASGGDMLTGMLLLTRNSGYFQMLDIDEMPIIIHDHKYGCVLITEAIQERR